MDNTQLDSRKHNVFFILSIIFVTNAILAELIGVKLFSFDKLVGFSILESGINFSAGIIMWPIVFVVSDIINEYFGWKGVQKISYTAALVLIYIFAFIYVVTLLPPADFWLSQNKLDVEKNPIQINSAFTTLFTQGLNIIIGSLTAFLLGQMIDAFSFQWIKGITGNKNLWLRATGSTAVSQLIDSFLILLIAFYFLGDWPLEMVLHIGLVQYIYKIIVAILLTPVIYIAHNQIDTYLGIKH